MDEAPFVDDAVVPIVGAADEMEGMLARAAATAEVCVRIGAVAEQVGSDDHVVWQQSEA